jgi:hypothetical protein
MVCHRYALFFKWTPKKCCSRPRAREDSSIYVDFLSKLCENSAGPGESGSLGVPGQIWARATDGGRETGPKNHLQHMDGG